MRILFLTHRLPYAPNRGDRVRSLNLIRTLARHHDVDLISLVHDAEEASHVGDLDGIAASVAIAAVPPVAKYLRGIQALVSGRPITHGMLDSPSIGSIIRTVVEAHPPDVVFSYCSGMARFALESPLRTIPGVLDMVDVDSNKWRELSGTAAKPAAWVYATESRRLSTFEALAARHMRSVLVVNDRERDSLLRLEPSADVQVVPNGVALDDLRPTGITARAPHVVFCGVMDYAPNEAAAVWMAQSVWPHVRARRPDARLFLVGSNPTAAVRRLAADSTVCVTGSVPDVRPYLWEASVGVAPLRVARGVQNKVLEAVAAGLPCVVTTAVAEGLPREVMAACGVAGDAEAFAAATLDLLEQTPAARAARAASADLEGFGWENRLSPVLDLVERARRY